MASAPGNHGGAALVAEQAEVQYVLVRLKQIRRRLC